jgi:hypothetical protein
METLTQTQLAKGNTEPNTNIGNNHVISNANGPVAEAETAHHNKNAARLAKAHSDMWAGAFWCIGGILVTAVSYNAVKDTGGTYIITWGAVVYGGYQFLKGLFNSIA